MVIKEVNVEKIETVGTKDKDISSYPGEIVRDNRDNKTIVTSVSVSKEFQEIINEHNLSPTEIFRRGVAVMGYDLGLPKFSSKLNEDRSKYVKEFLKRIEEESVLREKFEKFEKFEKMLDLYNKLKEVMEELK